MRNKFVQITMEETYTEVLTAMEDSKPELIKILEEHLDFDQLIPLSFHQGNYSEPRIETICFCSNNLLLVDNLPMISKLFPTLWITGFHPSLLCFKIDFY